MIEELFQKERHNLNYFFEHVDSQAIEDLVELLFQCTGIVMISGVGKSGFIAEKMAATMTSVGTRALFLSPSNALHGDIGIVSANDIFIMISKSGESEELLNLVPFIKNRGVKVVAVVGKMNSRLSKMSDVTIHLPLENELCTLNLAPTISTVTQMIFGDVVAVALMMRKKFTTADYALNHPSGRIGRHLTYRVKDLMLTGDDVPLCGSEDKLVDVLVELSNKRCGCVLVVDAHNVLIGIFTDGDLRRTLQKYGSQGLEAPMKEVMTRSPRSIASETMAAQAVIAMEEDRSRPITVLAVVDAYHKVLGVIKLHDLLAKGV